ncbi:MAG TPA: phosphate ABC transporter permease subunit PstC [Candidatus Dormibacteraeota bacterium]|jgi:phosphate transport system permease protein|nr:phosphate ABC transporter permease subunit PstC [Candidatus Dormibacteraeota bacterium]
MTLRWVSLVAALLPILLLCVIVGTMVASAKAAVIYAGLHLFTGAIFTFGNLYGGSPSVHNGVTAPHNAQYGAATLLVGTLLTSVIALAIALPVAVGGVLMLTERIPPRLQNGFSVFLELLAGIPSVVYGIWGVLILGPFFALHFFPALANSLGRIPFLTWFRPPVGAGEGLLTAGLVLSVMVIPIIAATTRDLLRSVPVLHKEGALALGMTPFEVVRVVTLPFVRNGILAAALLGWARALGETMAVLLISGNALNQFPQSIYSPVGTIAATIAATLDGALTDGTGMAVSALGALALVLLLVTLLTNWAGRMIVRRSSGAALPVGRGF